MKKQVNYFWAGHSPETRAPPGNDPANPAALFCITVGSGGLHIMINS